MNAKKIKRAYLVDASVLLLFFLSDDDRLKKKIGDILKHNEITALTLTKIEVSNALVYELKNALLVEETYKRFLALGIVFLDMHDASLKQARIIAKEVGDTVYDALYHAEALMHGMLFLTADQKYFVRSQHLGNIQLLDSAP